VLCELYDYLLSYIFFILFILWLKGIIMSKLIYSDESHAILGACFEVYKVMGCGFLEAVYQECLNIELRERGIPFISQCDITLHYKGQSLKQKFKPDLICFNKIIIEVKAVSNLADEHRAQILNYLNAARFPLGLLINFGHHPGLEYERFILSKPTEHTERAKK